MEATIDKLYELLGRREFSAWIFQAQREELIASLQAQVQMLQAELAAPKGNLNAGRHRNRDGTLAG